MRTDRDGIVKLLDALNSTDPAHSDYFRSQIVPHANENAGANKSPVADGGYRFRLFKENAGGVASVASTAKGSKRRVAKVNFDNCELCFRCSNACPNYAMQLDVLFVDIHKCNGCGICKDVCDGINSAISIVELGDEEQYYEDMANSLAARKGC